LAGREELRGGGLEVGQEGDEEGEAKKKELFFRNRHRKYYKKACGESKGRSSSGGEQLKTMEVQD
jgi:hypothetical protein